jgi:hypothetical protein
LVVAHARICALGVVAVLATGLAGCASSPGPLDAARSEKDVLPAVVDDDRLDDTSVRLLGKSPLGTKFYAAKAVGNDGMGLECLIAVPTDDLWSVSCGSSFPAEMSLSSGERVTFHPEGNASAADSAQQVGRYLTVQTR